MFAHQGTVDTREQFYRPFWAGPSQGQGVETQNYFNPKKAVDMQFNVEKIANTFRKPASMDNFYEGEPFGRDVLNYSAPYKQPYFDRLQRPQYFQQQTDYRPPVEYGTPTDWLSGIIEFFKNIINRILQFVGIKSTPVATAPQQQQQAGNANLNTGAGAGQNYTQGQRQGQVNFTQHGSRVDPEERIEYSSPFDTHTVIFGKQVVP